MRWLGTLWRVVGWLLTPLVVWAVSLWGAWLALSLSGRFSNPRTALLAAFGVALSTGTVALLLWMNLLRRSPRLRRSLHVTRTGLPRLEDPEPVIPPAPDAPPNETAP